MSLSNHSGLSRRTGCPLLWRAVSASGASSEGLGVGRPSKQQGFGWSFRRDSSTRTGVGLCCFPCFKGVVDVFTSTPKRRDRVSRRNGTQALQELAVGDDSKVVVRNAKADSLQPSGFSGGAHKQVGQVECRIGDGDVAVCLRAHEDNV